MQSTLRHYYLILLFLGIEWGVLSQNSKADYGQLAIDAYNSKNLELAKEYFGCIIDIDPNDSTAYFERGTICDENGEYLEAISDFTKQIAIDTSSVDSYFLRGIVYEKIGEPDKALNDYQQVIQLEYENSDAHYFSGLIYFNKHKHYRARKEFVRSININSKHAPAMATLGWVYYQNYRKKKGQQLIHRATSFEEENRMKAFTYEALIHLDRGNTSETLNSLISFYRQFPNNLPRIPLSDFPLSLTIKWNSFSSELRQMSSLPVNFDTLSYAKTLLITNQPELADQLISKLMISDPKNPALLLFKTKALEQKANYQSALTSINELISLSPETIEAYLERATIKKKLNQHIDACQDYKFYIRHSSKESMPDYWPECIR